MFLSVKHLQAIPSACLASAAAQEVNPARQTVRSAHTWRGSGVGLGLLVRLQIWAVFASGLRQEDSKRIRERISLAFFALGGGVSGEAV